MRRLSAVLLIGLMFLLPGCWSRKEITELAIIVAMGYDYEPGPMPYRVTMQVARVNALVRGGAGQGQSQGPTVEVITGVGATPHEAARLLQRAMPRRFHPQHNEVWIIGEELARRGITPLIDYFERLQLHRPNMLVLIAHGPARPVLQLSENMERTLAESVTGLMRFRTYTASTLRITVNDVGMQIARTGRHAVVPGIKVESEIVDQGRALAVLDSLAMFHGDRMVDWLPPEANMGFLWVRNKVGRGVLSVPCPGEPQKQAAVELVRGHTINRPTLEAGEPVMRISTEMEAELTAQECRQNLATPKGMSQLSKAVGERVSQEISRAVRTAQEHKTDVLGFGQDYYHHLPDYWRRVAPRWDEEIFPGLTTRITSRVEVRRPGLATKPIPYDPDTGETR